MRILIYFILACQLPPLVVALKSLKQRDQVKKLKAKARRIAFNSERYHSWWIGHEAQDNYHPIEPASYSVVRQNHSSPFAIFTSILDIQGTRYHECTSLEHCIHSYFGSLRSWYSHDIVMAIPFELDEKLRDILIHNQVIIYEIPHSLCKHNLDSITCGSSDNQIPGTLFMYYFYELWALKYHSKAVVMISEFTRDSKISEERFQEAVPFMHSYQLALFAYHPITKERTKLTNKQQFSPKLFYKRVMAKCYTPLESHNISTYPLLDTANVYGTRDGVIVWTHSITMQLQELLARVDSLASAGCLVDHVERVFMQYIVYSKRLRKYMQIKITE